MIGKEAKERQNKLAVAREVDKRGEPVPERIPDLVKGEARRDNKTAAQFASGCAVLDSISL